MYTSRGFLAVVVGLVLGLVLVTGCASKPRGTETQPEPSSPSSSYLSQEVQAGWKRTVGKGNGLVLVFESALVAAAPNEDLPYRFVLFNESGAPRTWEDALFVVRFERVDGRGGFGYSGEWPISDLGNHFDPPSLALPSGESTTHAGVLSGRELPDLGTYASRLVGSFKVGKRNEPPLVTAPEIEVEFRQ